MTDILKACKTVSIEFATSKQSRFEYDQGDVICIEYDELYDLVHALATTKADALTLANEVRRMEADILEAALYLPDQPCAANGVATKSLNNRPAAVTAAMERYPTSL